MDLANFLTAEEVLKLSQQTVKLSDQGGPQIVFLTVPDLQGLPIEEYSIKVAEDWKLGTKEKDNGLLVIVAKNERLVRIEVGNGIEGEITDYFTSKFTRNIFPDYFKRGQFYQAFDDFVLEVANQFKIKIGSNSHIMRRSHYKSRRSRGGQGIILVILGVLVAGSILFKESPVKRGLFSGIGLGGLSFFMGLPIILILTALAVGLLLGLVGIGNLLAQIALNGGARNSHHYGGGGGFGGGFGGGGGGFSGGGSSGRW